MKEKFQCVKRFLCLCDDGSLENLDKPLEVEIKTLTLNDAIVLVHVQHIHVGRGY